MADPQITGESALRDAIKKVARAASQDGSDHNHTRQIIIQRAVALDLAGLVPDNWAPDGTLRSSQATWISREERETWNDLYAGLQTALDDLFDAEDGWWYVWVQDFTDTEVIFCAGGDLYSAPYSVETDGPITLGERVKVRPVTTYVKTATARSHSRSAAAAAAQPLIEWRRGKADAMKGRMERRKAITAGLGDLEIRENDDGSVELVGYASVTERAYDVGFYQETIKRGAFKRTLSEQPDVVLLLNHEGLPLARTKSGTLDLSEDDHGLRIEADLDPDDPDTRALIKKRARGDLDGQMSFAFQVTGQSWSDDYSERTITAVSLHRGDVSVVTHGANPATTSSVRAQQAVMELRRAGSSALIAALVEWRDFTLQPTEQRVGKTLSGETMDTLGQVLDLIAAADEAVDEAQPLLAALMGVPNPDQDDDTAAADDGDNDESDGEAARSQIPDHTTAAMERLAALRGGRSRR